jgi:RNA polymerase sigma-70 factor (ECF subfamily)
MSVENIPESGALAIPVEGAVTGSAAQPLAALPSLDEKLLIERAQSGERAAFDELVHRYDRDLLRLALNILRSTEDARDVYQESFLKIYRNLHRFRSDCSFYTWIYRIVTNVCFDHLRRRRSRPEDQAPVSSWAQEDNSEDFFDRQQDARAGADPERCVWGQELGERIDGAMELLSPRERMVFEMKHFHGLRLRAIGDALGTTEETVKNSLFRATRKLRAQLQGLR